VTAITVGFGPGSLGVARNRRYACGALMKWVERFGRYLALAFLALLWPVVDAYQRGLVPGASVGVLVVAAGGYCLVYGWYCLVGFRSRGPVAPAVTVASLTLLGLVLERIKGAADANFFLISLMVAGFGLSPSIALAAIALVGVVSIADTLLLAQSLTPELVVQLALYIPVILLFGGGAMALRYLLQALTELREARVEIAQHATDRERARIARDLHDLLGHSLSLITLKGELATRLLPEGLPGTDEVRDMLTLSRDSLQQVREAVSGYRQPTLATELSAARIALTAAGIDVKVNQRLGALNRETEAVLGWVIREATTNVVRHSGAKHCQISLKRQDGQIEVDVVNDGWRVAQRPPGNGLRGLEERLAAIGGKLDAVPLSSAGFHLRATAPDHSGQAMQLTPESI
jgi:two-component system sensor histidine kinase DesK